MTHTVYKGETIRTDQDTVLGSNIWLGPGVTIRGPVIIGGGCRIYPGATIGYRAESYSESESDFLIIIGEDTVLREGVVVQRGLKGQTFIGSDCYLMHACHIGHDAVLHDRVTMSPYTLAGGEVVLCEGVNLGMGAMTHQHVIVGAWTMIGMGSMVTESIPPGCTAVGSPARIVGRNATGLARMSVSEEMLALAHEDFLELYAASPRQRMAGMRA